MDAVKFRLKAARARELAQTGDDFRLSRMLLEVASDLDAEAEAIDAQKLASAMAPFHADNTAAMPIRITAVSVKT